jgi:hypothetical protein
LNKLNLCLTEWQARIFLEAINELEAKGQRVNQTTENDDERAEYANDLVELGMTKRHIVENATQAFGEAVTDFDRTSV